MSGDGVLRFEMKGSRGDIYAVTAERVGHDAIRMTCSCQAGENGAHCHHRIELLRGDVTALASGNGNDVVVLASLIKGSTLEVALTAFVAAEAALEQAKRVRASAGKRLSRLLQG